MSRPVLNIQYSLLITPTSAPLIRDVIYGRRSAYPPPAPPLTARISPNCPRYISSHLSAKDQRLPNGLVYDPLLVLRYRRAKKKTGFFVTDIAGTQVQICKRKKDTSYAEQNFLLHETLIDNTKLQHFTCYIPPKRRNILKIIHQALAYAPYNTQDIIYPL